MLSTFLNVSLLARTHRDVLWREGSILLVPAVASTPFLAWASRRIDGRLLTILAGALTVLSAGALLTGVRWRRATGVGCRTGGGRRRARPMNVIGSIGGPALAIYSVNSDWPPARARSTLQVVFLATNLVAIAALGLPTSRDVGGWLVLFGALTVGWIAGLRLHRVVPEDGARVATLGVAALGGLVALIRAL